MKVPKHDEKLIRPKLPKSAEFASILFVHGLGLRVYGIGCGLWENDSCTSLGSAVALIQDLSVLEFKV